MVATKTRVGKSGRIVLPAKYRKTLGWGPGDDIVMVLEADGVRLSSPRLAVKEAQRIVRRFVPENRSLAADLIHDRRRELGTKEEKMRKPKGKRT